VTVYAKQAEQRERIGDLDGAMQLLAKCLQVRSCPAAARMRGDSTAPTISTRSSEVCRALYFRGMQQPRPPLFCALVRMQAAEKCSDAAAGGHINHRIGLIHQRRGDWQQALACQATFLAAARDSGDRRAEGMACCSYAECQRQLGDLEGAVASLEAYLEISRGQVGGSQGET
jgi:tetratricopeptide (TPR) repeat protein